MKEELLKSLKKNDTVEESDSDIKSIVDQSKAMKKIKHYDKIIKTGNKNTKRYESIQGQMLEKFKDSEGIVENVGISRSTIYFKIGLYKFLKKYPALKTSSLPQTSIYLHSFKSTCRCAIFLESRIQVNYC